MDKYVKPALVALIIALLLLVAAALAGIVTTAPASANNDGRGNGQNQGQLQAQGQIQGQAQGQIQGQSQLALQANSQSALLLSSNNVSFEAAPANTSVRHSGEIANAPSLGGLALGGGHPCAYSPATGQISIIGGGLGLGGMKVDSACLLMVMGYSDPRAQRAAEYMIAARDDDACVAMEMAGMVTCDDGDEAAAPPAKPGMGARCEMIDGQIHFRPSSASARDGELEACKASF
jgi:hypothetical protein